MELLLHKSTIVSLLCVSGVAFIIGRSTATQIPPVEKKIIDTEAVTKAVEAERKKIIAQYSKKQVRDYVRLPTGEVHIHDVVESKAAQKEVVEKVKIDSGDTKTHSVAETVLKTPANDYSIELLLGKEKSDLLSTLPSENLIYGVNVSRRMFGSTWLGVWGNTREEFGVSVRVDF